MCTFFSRITVTLEYKMITSQSQVYSLKKVTDTTIFFENQNLSHSVSRIVWLLEKKI